MTANKRPFSDATDPFGDFDHLPKFGSAPHKTTWVPNPVSQDPFQDIEWVPESRFDDHQQGYIIDIQIPDVPKEDITIGINRRSIEVRIAQGPNTTSELRSSTKPFYEKEITLPEDANTHGITATFHDRALRIGIGRRSTTSCRPIVVKFR